VVSSLWRCEDDLDQVQEKGEMAKEYKNIFKEIFELRKIQNLNILFIVYFKTKPPSKKLKSQKND